MSRVDRATATTWQLCSLLLDYPDEQWRERLPVIRAEVSALPARTRPPLEQFLAHVDAVSPTELAADYVATFDTRRRCCLYLTYYAHGDTRKRGMALLAFKQAYRAAGVELTDDELPDHLAVVLEFAATADQEAGYKLLTDNRAGLELLRLALHDAGSPWGTVLDAVSATLPALRGDEREAARRLAAQGPPAEEVGLQPFGPPEFMPSTTGARR
ncbi:MAG TPA: nitrate reductase molybdenum cofactor assembly chaperone [Actinomycetales bacterium]|nr:nitrate reductase molybdenum cofactor assembly chaperone [Actinomycetales bacterium]